MFKNIIGLIVEYNPFHNGHLHHIEEIDRLFEDNIKIAVMSGDFVQRGEPSLINKFEKTKIALSQGIDIVIELPAFYSTQSAEIFAKGSVNLLNKFSCSHIVFGSESNDLDKLKRIATISLTKEFELSLREFLAEGFSYPTAFSKALFDEKLGSNDILAMEYLKAIKVINPKIEACSIKREKTGYYDDEKDNFSSATYIRKILLDCNEKKEDKLNKIKNLVPEFSYKILEENFEETYYIIQVASGLLNKNSAIVAVKWHSEEISFYGYAQEGLINQHTAEKAVEKLIEKIHQSFQKVDFIIINPAAYTHTSVALRDALLAVSIPFVEVHLSNIYKREPFRHHSYFSDVAEGVVCGCGAQGYDFALQFAVNYLSKK